MAPAIAVCVYRRALRDTDNVFQEDILRDCIYPSRMHLRDTCVNVQGIYIMYLRETLRATFATSRRTHSSEQWLLTGATSLQGGPLLDAHTAVTTKGRQTIDTVPKQTSNFMVPLCVHAYCIMNS